MSYKIAGGLPEEFPKTMGRTMDVTDESIGSWLRILQNSRSGTRQTRSSLRPIPGSSGWR